MENRDRDKMSQRSSSTQAGDINRSVDQSKSSKDLGSSSDSSWGDSGKGSQSGSRH